jgi:hypothetical protein
MQWYNLLQGHNMLDLLKEVSNKSEEEE